jgi:hypothetical protein
MLKSIAHPTNYYQIMEGGELGFLGGVFDWD